MTVSRFKHTWQWLWHPKVSGGNEWYWFAHKQAAQCMISRLWIMKSKYWVSSEVVKPDSTRLPKTTAEPCNCMPVPRLLQRWAFQLDNPASRWLHIPMNFNMLASRHMVCRESKNVDCTCEVWILHPQCSNWSDPEASVTWFTASAPSNSAWLSAEYEHMFSSYSTDIHPVFT